MLGTSRLLGLALRALILLLIMSALWFTVVVHYNRLLLAVTELLVPDSITLKIVGSHILFSSSAQQSVPTSIDSLILHWGLILLVVLVLAVPDVKLQPRLTWLVVMVLGTFLLHIIGLALMANSIELVIGIEASERPVLSAFAILWGLLPAIIGGLWVFRWWLPRVSRN